MQTGLVYVYKNKQKNIRIYKNKFVKMCNVNRWPTHRIMNLVFMNGRL